MAVQAVKDYFAKYGMEDRVLELDESSATVELAAQALHCEPGRIAKTLSFLVEEQPVLVVTAGNARIDNAKYRHTFHEKAKMLKPDEVLKQIGHAVGGVCPFAVKEGVKVYLDQSLKEYESVYPACGSSNSAIELTIPELEEYSSYLEWVDVCKE